MSAGDELRMEKARILSMVWSVTDDGGGWKSAEG
nr:unknown [Zea mays]